MITANIDFNIEQFQYCTNLDSSNSHSIVQECDDSIKSINYDCMKNTNLEQLLLQYEEENSRDKWTDYDKKMLGELYDASSLDDYSAVFDKLNVEKTWIQRLFGIGKDKCLSEEGQRSFAIYNIALYQYYLSEAEKKYSDSSDRIIVLKEYQEYLNLLIKTGGKSIFNVLVQQYYDLLNDTAEEIKNNYDNLSINLCQKQNDIYRNYVIFTSITKAINDNGKNGQVEELIMVHFNNPSERFDSFVCDFNYSFMSFWGLFGNNSCKYNLTTYEPDAFHELKNKCKINNMYELVRKKTTNVISEPFFEELFECGTIVIEDNVYYEMGVGMYDARIIAQREKVLREGLSVFVNESIITKQDVEQYISESIESNSPYYNRMKAFCSKTYTDQEIKKMMEYIYNGRDSLADEDKKIVNKMTQDDYYAIFDFFNTYINNVYSKNNSPWYGLRNEFRDTLAHMHEAKERDL